MIVENFSSPLRLLIWLFLFLDRGRSAQNWIQELIVDTHIQASWRIEKPTRIAEKKLETWYQIQKTVYTCKQKIGLELLFDILFLDWGRSAMNLHTFKLYEKQTIQLNSIPWITFIQETSKPFCRSFQSSAICAESGRQ